MNIAKAIGWKFNHQTGMVCREIDGVMTIIEFPGGIPSLADQDLWLSEYADFLRKESIKQEANNRIIALDPEWTAENHEQKQRNDLMQGAGLLLNIAKALNSGIQADIDNAIAEGDAAMVKAFKIEDIRNISNLAEANGDSLTKFQSDLDAAGY